MKNATKNSYKLFSMNWHILCGSNSTKTMLPQAEEHNPTIAFYKYGYELFDTNGFYRYIPLSVFLSLEKEDKIIEILNFIKEYDKLFVLCDILPENPVIIRYLLEEIGTIIECIKSKSGKIAILTALPDKLQRFNLLIMQHNLGVNHGRP